MRSRAEIEDMFNLALDKLEALSKKRQSDQYSDGVRQALGWVLDEYDDAPIE